MKTSNRSIGRDSARTRDQLSMQTFTDLSKTNLEGTPSPSIYSLNSTALGADRREESLTSPREKSRGVSRNSSFKILRRNQSTLVAPTHVAQKADIGIFNHLFGEQNETPHVNETSMGHSMTSRSLASANRREAALEANLLRIRREQAERSVRVQEQSDDLLENYTQKRKVIQRANELSKLMKRRAEEMVDMEERNLLLRGTGTAEHLVTELHSNVSRKSDRSSESNDNSPHKEDYGVSDGFSVQANGEEGDDLAMDAVEKVKKLQKLRTYQKALTELDEAEEEQKMKQAQAKQLSTRASFYRRKEAAEPTASQATAQELRKTFDAMFDQAQSRGYLPPEPPTTFTSTALGTTLEYLTQSMNTIEQATDIMCVTATFKTKEEAASITAPLRALCENVSYAKKCYEVLLSHLRHFETGQKALLYSGSSEVTLLQDQFLHQKESLTVEMQQEKQSEELRNGLKTKLLNLRKRYLLWEHLLLAKRTSSVAELNAESLRQLALKGDPQQLAYPLAPHDEPRPPLINVFTIADEENSLSAFPFQDPQPRLSLEGPLGAASPTSVAQSTKAPQSTRARPSVTSTCIPSVSNTSDFKPNSQVSYLSQYLKSYNNSLLPPHQSEAASEEEDSLIASTWGNPYRDRVKRTEEASRRDQLREQMLANRTDSLSAGTWPVGASPPGDGTDRGGIGSSHSSRQKSNNASRGTLGAVSPMDHGFFGMDNLSSNPDRSVSVLSEAVSLEGTARERIVLLLQSALVSLAEEKHHPNSEHPTQDSWKEEESEEEVLMKKKVRNSIQRLIQFLDKMKK